MREVRGGQTASFSLKKVCDGQIGRKVKKKKSFFLLHLKKKNYIFVILVYFFLSGQAFVYKERNGNGFPEVDATGHLGV